MSKVSTNTAIEQEKLLFSFPEAISNKRIKADFNAPDISSNGGLVLAPMKGSLAEKIGQIIPDYRNQMLVVHSYRDMVCQRVGQIMCGYEDANDCDRLRHDSALKLALGKLPSEDDLSSQPTMTRLENNISARTLYRIGELFVKEYVSSFDKAPQKVIIDVDDTNANTYGNQQLTLFNDYYGEYCYMPLLLFDGMSGKLILPILRPGRRTKSLNVFRILRRVIKCLHECWPKTIFELRGDSHFCSHEFMDWSDGLWYVRFTTGLSGNSVLLDKVKDIRKRAENKFNKHHEPVCWFREFYYKAKSWEHEQRVVVKIEVNSLGTNIRFVVTSNRSNKPETVYHRYCHRGEMELWIKDLKYLKTDRMSCNSYRANCFRLFLYCTAFQMAFKMKNTIFEGTEIQQFTMDSFIKRVFLSAIFIVEKKTFVKISFSPHHRHREMMEQALQRLTA